jgi:hypothetical protein
MQENVLFIKIKMAKIRTLKSEAEKMLKKTKKKGLIEVLDNSIIDEIFDKVEQDMEDYRIENNYKTGRSRIDSEEVLINYYFN